MSPDLFFNKLSPDKIKLIKFVLPAILWGIVVTAEMSGILNSPNIYDLPAEIIAFLGAASIVELIINEKSRSVWNSNNLSTGSPSSRG